MTTPIYCGITDVMRNAHEGVSEVLFRHWSSAAAVVVLLKLGRVGKKGVFLFDKGAADDRCLRLTNYLLSHLEIQIGQANVRITIVALGYNHIVSLKKNIMRRKFGAKAVRLNYHKERPDMKRYAEFIVLSMISKFGCLGRNQTYFVLPHRNQYKNKCLLLLCLVGRRYASAFHVNSTKEDKRRWEVFKRLRCSCLGCQKFDHYHR